MTTSKPISSRRRRARLAMVGAAGLSVAAAIVAAVLLASELDAIDTTAIGMLVAVAGAAGFVGALAARTPAPPTRVPAVDDPAASGTEPAGGTVNELLLQSALEVRDLLHGRSDPLAGRIDSGLARAGFTIIEPPAGDPFDPNIHIAVDTEPADDDHPPGTIVDVEQIGLTDGDELVRRASVVVRSQP